jgi:hypothetical protein
MFDQSVNTKTLTQMFEYLQVLWCSLSGNEACKGVYNITGSTVSDGLNSWIARLQLYVSWTVLTRSVRQHTFSRSLLSRHGSFAPTAASLNIERSTNHLGLHSRPRADVMSAYLSLDPLTIVNIRARSTLL